jgi:hypothetical protein
MRTISSTNEKAACGVLLLLQETFADSASYLHFDRELVSTAQFHAGAF